jgi:hypothetical protein
LIGGKRTILLGNNFLAFFDMRILNTHDQQKIDNAIFYLTKEEVGQLIYDLQQLLSEDHRHNNHKHISSDDFQKELIICIYEEGNVEGYGFDERSKKLILEDK